MTESNVHERLCWDCGNVAEHSDSVITHVLCKKCGSQDTRLVRKPIEKEETKLRSELFLPEIASDFLKQIDEWKAEGETVAMNHIITMLNQVYDVGWHEAAARAMRVCETRASSGNDWGTTRCNEAIKCSLQIEAVLVTHTMGLPEEI